MTGFHRRQDRRHQDHQHDHHHVERIPRPGARTRRAFLGDIGGGAMALALFAPALAACTSSTESTAPDETDETSSAGPDEDLRWARTNLGFVSAYVVARGNRAAIVDTGVDGSADAIGQTLSDLGLTYNDVENVILTHNHGDHIGSTTEVLNRAVNATAFAGEPDLGQIAGDISALVGGEDVFGLEMLATPGHTAGSMSAIDHGAGLLIAGDAIAIDGDAAAEPPAQFTADPDGARASIELMAQLSFNVLLVGHGNPIEDGADAAVAALAASF